jgi:hypothetical protein
MSTGTCPAPAWLSFQRIVDIPFGTCVAALDSWQLTGQDRGRHVGHSLVCGPAERDRDNDTYRIQVRLARGPLRPPARMRLEVDHWSSTPPRTALELIPCGHVRPSAAYFRAGHLLLDSLTRSLARHLPAQALTPSLPASHPPIRTNPGPADGRPDQPPRPARVPHPKLPGRSPEQNVMYWFQGLGTNPWYKQLVATG